MQRARILLTVIVLAALIPGAAIAQWQIGGLPVCTSAGDQTFPVAIPDGAGGLLLAWNDGRNGVDSDIYAYHVLASGTLDPGWPAGGRAVCTATGDQADVVIVSDGAGGLILTWDDYRNGTNFDIYAQHVLASGAVDPGWPANGRALCTATGQQFFPAIASDGSGGAIVAWPDSRGGASYDVYAQHVLASGAVDPAWPGNGRQVCAAPDDQFDVVTVSDGSHGAIVAWSDFRSGLSFDVYAQHVLASGAVDSNWPVDGRAVCVAADDQSDIAMLPDGSGGAIIAWDDRRNGVDYDIYAHHVLASGAVDPAWPADGLGLCTLPGKQVVPAMTRDAGTGAIVTWADSRGADADIYAQHVLISGAVDSGWPANGRALCTAVNNQVSPSIATDGSGGAVVVWEDLRGGVDYDLYGQHVRASGALDAAWGAQGRPLCLASGDQLAPVIVTDGAGGAVATWYDQRSVSGYDVYAQHITSGGDVVAVSSPPVLHLGPLSAWPNPVRSSAVILFDVPASERASLSIFDAAGREVRRLLTDVELPAGGHELHWDGSDEAGRPLKSGIYFVRMSTPTASHASRFTMLR